MAVLAVSLDRGPDLLRLAHIGEALGLGLFVGMEREHRQKSAGLRTFGFVAVIGAVGGVLGTPYGVASLALTGTLAVLLNVETLLDRRRIELTTSAALVVTCLVGLLSGQGHYVTPAAVALATAGLLAWKEELAGFTLGLTTEEIRSAILLGVLGFVVYPILPSHDLGPSRLIDPRLAWLTVILVAGIGFVNYVLLKLFGQRGVELTGFLGGLVNSSVTATELAHRLRDEPSLEGPVYRGLVLTTAAMALRNGVILAVLAPAALLRGLAPLAILCAGSAVGSRFSGDGLDSAAAPKVSVSSPFSLSAALRFGAVFLVLQVLGGLAHRDLGTGGFLAVAAVGGLVSSASAVASAGALAAHHSLTPSVAAQGAVIASATSAFVTVPLVWRIGRHRRVTRRTCVATAVLVAASLVAVGLQRLIAFP